MLKLDESTLIFMRIYDIININYLRGGKMRNISCQFVGYDYSIDILSSVIPIARKLRFLFA